MRMTLLLFALVARGNDPSGLFEDVTLQAGIRWTHFNGESSDRYLVESTTGGIGFWISMEMASWICFLVNGGETPGNRSRSPIRNALYRNIGDGKFENVAEKAGVETSSVLRHGRRCSRLRQRWSHRSLCNRLSLKRSFPQQRRRDFQQRDQLAGVENAGEWATSAAWFDYDRDGRLDLFVANYAEFSFDDKRRCEFAGRPVYCAQTEYKGRPPKLYHNEGNGKFRDVTTQASLQTHVGRALGVVAIDIDADGWIDLFVARDASPNLLLLNQKNGTFRDVAFEAEIAYNADGIARAGMGVDAGDVDGDGKPDSSSPILIRSTTHCIRVVPAMPFREITVPSRLAALPALTWVGACAFSTMTTMEISIY